MKRLKEKYLYYKNRFDEWKYYCGPIWKARLLHPKGVFFVYTPTHGNMGDHAIAFSVSRLLKEEKIVYKELNLETLFDLQKRKWLGCMNGKTIIIDGGGNLGTLWDDLEDLTQDIILSNKRSRIIVMPNSFYYGKSEKENKKLQKSIAVYSSHKHLTIYAREAISYGQMKEIYKDVRQCPDMVLFLDETGKEEERKGCFLCLRDDIEKTLSEEERNIVLEQAEALFPGEVLQGSTVNNYKIFENRRESELQKKFDEFRKARLVITDRLHGMIFAAITATPCIVLNSKSPKVRGCYEWLKDLNYICFCEDVKEIQNIYREMPHDNCVFPSELFAPYYEMLKAEIRKMTR